jgi:hypothetical protein
VETATQPADFYTLEGHTAEGRRVHDGKPSPKPPVTDQRAKLRDELLKKWQNRGK